MFFALPLQFEYSFLALCILCLGLFIVISIWKIVLTWEPEGHSTL